jgi:hypothetical protein
MRITSNPANNYDKYIEETTFNPFLKLLKKKLPRGSVPEKVDHEPVMNLRCGFYGLSSRDLFRTIEPFDDGSYPVTESDSDLDIRVVENFTLKKLSRKPYWHNQGKWVCNALEVRMGIKTIDDLIDETKKSPDVIEKKIRAADEIALKLAVSTLSSDDFYCDLDPHLHDMGCPKFCKNELGKQFVRTLNDFIFPYHSTGLNVEQLEDIEKVQPFTSF